MRSNVRSPERRWWTRWSLQVSELAPSPLRGAWRTILFLANALLFIAIATPLMLPRVVAGVAAVIAVNVLWFGVDAHLYRTPPRRNA